VYFPSFIPQLCSYCLKPIKVYKTRRNSCMTNYTNINYICIKLGIFINDFLQNKSISSMEKGLGLWYNKGSCFDLIAYCDADYAGDKIERKSTSETSQFLEKALISWSCRTQNIIALSTTRAEYVSAANIISQSGMKIFPYFVIIRVQ